MTALKAGLPLGVAVDKVADQPRIVDDSVWEFEKSFLEALAIVLAVCFLFSWAGGPASWWRHRCRWYWRWWPL